jgi:hypothetical protein
MRQSLNIIKQAIKLMENGPIKSSNLKLNPPTRSEMKNSMEAVIHHFKLFTEGLVVPFGEDDHHVVANTNKPVGGGPKKSPRSPRPGSVLPVNEPTTTAGTYLMSSQKSDTSEIGLLNTSNRHSSMQHLLIAGGGSSSPSTY